MDKTWVPQALWDYVPNEPKYTCIHAHIQTYPMHKGTGSRQGTKTQTLTHGVTLQCITTYIKIYMGKQCSIRRPNVHQCIPLYANVWGD